MPKGNQQEKLNFEMHIWSNKLYNRGRTQPTPPNGLPCKSTCLCQYNFSTSSNVHTSKFYLSEPVGDRPKHSPVYTFSKSPPHRTLHANNSCSEKKKKREDHHTPLSSPVPPISTLEDRGGDAVAPPELQGLSRRKTAGSLMGRRQGFEPGFCQKLDAKENRLDAKENRRKKKMTFSLIVY